MNEKTVTIPNISCGHCVKTIEREVGELEGVRSVSTDQSSRTVTVAWDDETTTWQAVSDLLVEINYPPAE